MAKVKRPNEVREEVRKQMTAKFKAEVEQWKKSAQEYRSKWAKASDELRDLRDENAELREKLEAQKEWIERLMEFVNMPDDKRSAAVKEYVADHRITQDFRDLFAPYFDTLNRLNILSW